MFNIKVGDKVTRIMAGQLMMYLTVTEVTEKRIICGPWEFSRKTGLEIDEDLGWTENASGSYLLPKESM